MRFKFLRFTGSLLSGIPNEYDADPRWKKEELCLYLCIWRLNRRRIPQLVKIEMASSCLLLMDLEFHLLFGTEKLART